jgi:hypothetical protein
MCPDGVGYGCAVKTYWLTKTDLFFGMCLRNLKALSSVQGSSYVQFIPDITLRLQIK